MTVSFGKLVKSDDVSESGVTAGSGNLRSDPLGDSPHRTCGTKGTEHIQGVQELDESLE